MDVPDERESLPIVRLRIAKNRGRIVDGRANEVKRRCNSPTFVLCGRLLNVYHSRHA